jgi:serine/threonine protein phosphatase 1
MEHKKLYQNNRRILIVGDVHGCLDELLFCLEKLNWNKETDLLVSVGDLIDRGPKSAETLDFAHEHIECVLGNHDSFMVDAITGYGDVNTWAVNGGMWALKDEAKQHYVSANNHGSWLLSLPIALEIELDTKELVGVIHAEVPTNINDWDLFTRMLSNNRIVQSAIWGRSRIKNDTINNHINGLKNLFVGHTVVPKPQLLGNIWYLDTGCVFYNKMTFAVIEPQTGKTTVSMFDTTEIMVKRQNERIRTT